MDDEVYMMYPSLGYNPLKTNTKTPLLATLKTGDKLTGLQNDNNIYTVVLKKEEDQTAYIGLHHAEDNNNIHDYKYYTPEELANKFANANSIIINPPTNKAGKIRRNTSSKKLKKRTTLKRRKTKSRK